MIGIGTGTSFTTITNTDVGNIPNSPPYQPITYSPSLDFSNAKNSQYYSLIF